MTPGWEVIRLGLANSYHPKPRFDLARRPRFLVYFAISAALWLAIFVGATIAFR
jgi:hypothetical protein